MNPPPCGGFSGRLCHRPTPRLPSPLCRACGEARFGAHDGGGRRCGPGTGNFAARPKPGTGFLKSLNSFLSPRASCFAATGIPSLFQGVCFSPPIPGLKGDTRTCPPGTFQSRVRPTADGNRPLWCPCPTAHSRLFLKEPARFSFGHTGDQTPIQRHPSPLIVERHRRVALPPQLSPLSSCRVTLSHPFHATGVSLLPDKARGLTNVTRRGLRRHRRLFRNRAAVVYPPTLLQDQPGQLRPQPEHRSREKKIVPRPGVRRRIRAHSERTMNVSFALSQKNINRCTPHADHTTVVSFFCLYPAKGTNLPGLK